MASKRIAFEIIENSGPNNLRDALKVQLAKATEVCIAVAFVTEAGLNEIIQPLRQVAAQGKVRFITGLYQRVTEPKALKTLLKIQDETRGNFAVCISREPQFHQKVYLLRKRTQATIIIGSSNLTREGLRSGGEINLMLSLSTDNPSFERVRAAFEMDWNGRAVPLKSEQIERYEGARPSPVKQRSYTEGQLQKILGAKPVREKAEDKQVNFWRDYIGGYVEKRTELIIQQTTNWDDKGYSWYGTGGPPRYQIGDRIFIFDFTVKQCYLVEVKDITRTPVSTPDGRHFVAFKRIGNYSRKFSDRFWTLLADEGIRQSNAQNAKYIKINSDKAKRLADILRNK